jgi:anthranilate synthase component 1
VHTTRSSIPRADPLTVYLTLSERFGADQVYLLESPAGPAKDCRYAVVGFGVLLTICVTANVVTVSGRPELVRFVTAATRHLVQQATAGGESRLVEPDQLWELLRKVQQLFSGSQGTEELAFLAYFGYDAVRYVEKLPKLIDGDDHIPDVCVVLHQGRVRIDVGGGPAALLVHQSRYWQPFDEAELSELLSDLPVAVADPPTASSSPAVCSDDTSEQTYLDNVRRCLGYIAIGDIYQVQIGHELTIRSTVSPVEVYRRLRARNPSPYMYLAAFAGHSVIGASPELFARIEDSVVTMRPIAGTLPHGGQTDELSAVITRLRTDPKEIAEHVMLVDLCRNDIGKVCERNTLNVDEMMSVERFSHVLHLVSTVVGRISGVDSYDVIRALFPSGTMTGAPKIRAMEIIESIEHSRRGLYAGALGLIDFDGRLNLALCIRTLFHHGDAYRTRASAGIVADSQPQREWRETLAKMSAAYWAVTGKELLP